MTDTDAPQLDLIGSSEAAAMAGVHVATIARWAADGTLPVAARLAGKTNPLLFHRADVERVASERRARAEAGHADPRLLAGCFAVAFVVGLIPVGLPWWAVWLLASPTFVVALTAVARDEPQPRHAGAVRGRRDRTADAQ